MDNVTYQDVCRIFGQMLLESRIQLEKLKHENVQLLELIKELKANVSASEGISNK